MDIGTFCRVSAPHLSFFSPFWAISYAKLLLTSYNWRMDKSDNLRLMGEIGFVGAMDESMSELSQR